MAISPGCIVKAYKEFSKQSPGTSKRAILDKAFDYIIERDGTNDFETIETYTLDMVLLASAYQYEINALNLTMDFVEDATRLQEYQAELQKYTEAYQSETGKAIREQLDPGVFTPSLEAITVPFQVRNTQTGAIIRGRVRHNLEKRTTQMTPVSSSNVKGVGVFRNELLVQFHTTGLTPQRTYRYAFDSPEMAQEAFKSLTTSSSPGRWIWHNIRGHKAGQKVTASKLGSSLSPPGQGLPTIGGTNKSLVSYTISNRTPVAKVANYDKMVKQLKRTTSNPSKKPNAGSRVEKLLAERKEIRELGVSPTKIGKQLSQLPDPYAKKDMNFIGNIFDLMEVGDFTEDSALDDCVSKKMSIISDEDPGLTQQQKLGKAFGMCRQALGIKDMVDFMKILVEDYKVKGHWRPKTGENRVWIRRHTRGEGTSIKDKPRMKPLDEWEIQRNNTLQLSKRFFEKEEYSHEIRMVEKKDDMGRDFHYEIYIANNVDYKRNAFPIALGNGALKKLPTPFQDVASVVFYKNISDDPNFYQDPEDIPAPYKRVGWDTKYKDVDAQISYTHNTIRIRAGSWGHAGSVRHEVGHGVWWWKIGGSDQQRYREIFERREWHLRRQGKVGKYQANDINEFFAVQFERFYSGNKGNMFPETVKFFEYINDKFGGENEL